jgi:hypothetical protein
MKTIRNIAILVGVGLALIVSGATSARAQALTTTAFSGTFTLPFEVQWANMTLPPGKYSLSYGHHNPASGYLVEVAGKKPGSPHGVILTRGRSQPSASENVLVCIRVGDKGYVRSLELSAIGEAAEFTLPHGVEVESRLIAKHQSKSGNTRIAEVRISVERVPIKLSAK